jgi:hypothetical protein
MHKAQVMRYQPRRTRRSQREDGWICLFYLCGLRDLRGAITSKNINRYFTDNHVNLICCMIKRKTSLNMTAAN